jgi:hypothetical protein
MAANALPAESFHFFECTRELSPSLRNHIFYKPKLGRPVEPSADEGETGGEESTLRDALWQVRAHGQ